VVFFPFIYHFFVWIIYADELELSGTTAIFLSKISIAELGGCQNPSITINKKEPIPQVFNGL
jgi:hypothetical protein